MPLIHESHSLISFLIECVYQAKQGNNAFPFLKLEDNRLAAKDKEKGTRAQGSWASHDRN